VIVRRLEMLKHLYRLSPLGDLNDRPILLPDAETSGRRPTQLIPY
jgi:hypothetical protein